jgi:hypothetical protein
MLGFTESVLLCVNLRNKSHFLLGHLLQCLLFQLDIFSAIVKESLELSELLIEVCQIGLTPLIVPQGIHDAFNRAIVDLLLFQRISLG